jgi:hypothetical protein
VVEDFPMETTTAVAPVAPEAEPPMGTMARITGVLFSPSKTFADIAKKPNWVAVFLLLVVFALGISALIGQKTNWRSFFERQMSQNSRFDNMDQAQKDKILESQVTWAPKIAFVFGPIGVGIAILLVAVIYWGAFNLFKGAGLKFGAGFAITVYAFVPGLVSSVLALIVLLIKPTGEVDPEHFLASSLSAYLPDPSPAWLDKLGQSIELFWIWSLVLIAIGFSAANPKKIKPGAAYGIVFGLWLLWVVCKVGWAAI